MRRIVLTCLAGLALAVAPAGRGLAQQPTGSMLLDAPPTATPVAPAPAKSPAKVPANAMTTPSTSLLLPPAAKTDAAPAPVLDGVTLDPPHTSTTFWIRHIVAPVAGRFDTVSGSIDIPAKNMAKGRVTFAVKTQSVDTGVAARDTHLRTAEFLDVATYPEMQFESVSIASAGKGAVKVTGKLTIKDVTKTVAIPVKLLGVKSHPMMPCVDVAGYEASFSINRLDYHVGTGKYFKMGAVGDAVDIRISGETLAKRPDCVQPPTPQESSQPQPSDKPQPDKPAQ